MFLFTRGAHITSAGHITHGAHITFRAAEHIMQKSAFTLFFQTAVAEDQLRQQSQLEEQRVAALENQISQVSELLGTYEKAKQKDQLAIQKLKERILQLDLENKTLALAASSRSPLAPHSPSATSSSRCLYNPLGRSHCQMCLLHP